MKNVFFDLMVAQPMGGSKFHGGGEYTKTIFRELCSRYIDEINLNVFYNPDLFIDDWILNLIKEKDIRTFKVRSYDELNNLDEFSHADTLFAGLLTGLSKIKVKPSMKVIGVYHGFRWLEKPTDITALLYEDRVVNCVKDILKLLFAKTFEKKVHSDYKKQIMNCTDIVGVSRHSGYAARLFFPEFDPAHIHMLYSPEKYVETTDSLNNPETEKYILMLGGDRWVKNIYRGVMALDELFSSNQLQGYTVHIVGGIPKKIERRIKNLSLFRALNYLSPYDLEREYFNCDFFFYPTLNEGFGYPPQEAMKYGRTCLISAVSSLPEIYHDAVYYCNPYDITEMKTRLLEASTDKICIQKIQAEYQRIAISQRDSLDKLCRLIIE